MFGSGAKLNEQKAVAVVGGPVGLFYRGFLAGSEAVRCVGGASDRGPPMAGRRGCTGANSCGCWRGVDSDPAAMLIEHQEGNERLVIRSGTRDWQGNVYQHTAMQSIGRRGFRPVDVWPPAPGRLRLFRASQRWARGRAWRTDSRGPGGRFPGPTPEMSPDRPGGYRVIRGIGMGRCEPTILWTVAVERSGVSRPGLS